MAAVGRGAAASVGSIGRAVTSGGVAVSGSGAGARIVAAASSASRVGSRSMAMAAVVSGAGVRARVRARSVASSRLLRVTLAPDSHSLSRHLHVNASALDQLAVALIHGILSSFGGFEGDKSETRRISSDPDIDDSAELLKTLLEFLLSSVGNITDVDPTRRPDVIQPTWCLPSLL